MSPLLIVGVNTVAEPRVGLGGGQIFITNFSYNIGPHQIATHMHMAIH